MNNRLQFHTQGGSPYTAPYPVLLARSAPVVIYAGAVRASVKEAYHEGM